MCRAIDSLTCSMNARVADQYVAGTELRQPSRCDDHSAAVQFSGGRGGVDADLAPLRP